jgi:hypothetical protein
VYECLHEHFIGGPNLSVKDNRRNRLRICQILKSLFNSTKDFFYGIKQNLQGVYQLTQVNSDILKKYIL